MITRTKVVCTIGPRTSSEEMLNALLDAGMNIARLNFSHGSHEEHAKVITRLQTLRQERGVPLAIMLDTKGPEIRIGKIRHGAMNISKGQKLSLVARELEGDEQGVSLYPASVISHISPGVEILVDDGYIHAKVTKIIEDGLEIEFTVNGTLKSHKSVSIRGVDVDLPFMTDKDREDLRFGIEQGVDFVAASFVRYPEDVKSMKKFLAENGRPDMPIIAKIENQSGVQNFNQIADVADGIMIARGDLGIELSVVEVPVLQKRMAKIARDKGRFCIIATQMLESMIHNLLPTRAEVSDIANAIYDGASAVMLSGETASGNYPIEAVNIMKAVISKTEGNISCDEFSQCDDGACILNVSSGLKALGSSVVSIVKRAKVRAIVVYTENGVSPVFLAKYRSEIPVLAVTTSSSLYHRLSAEWGVYPMLTGESNRTVWRRQACLYGLEQRFFSEDDRILVLSRSSGSRETNMLAIASVKDIIRGE
ncbi:pyruvate kinase [Chlamydiifrater phoenicopteri]|uniref:pyruvate kinase n=1 Tax=Chlamydiifrater phoenicopteri TaxID=2681469 RepID=UPI001BCBA22E|nr:pyruvate kinase [Chlamydiifrater phoenicopteri]